MIRDVNLNFLPEICNDLGQNQVLHVCGSCCSFIIIIPHSFRVSVTYIHTYMTHLTGGGPEIEPERDCQHFLVTYRNPFFLAWRCVVFRAVMLIRTIEL